MYLSVDLTPDLEEIVTSAARAAGYQLGVDQRLINGMLGLPGPGGDNVSFRGEFNPASSYLTAERDGRTLRVKIIRDGKIRVFAYGRGVTWGQWCMPPAGKAFVTLHMSLPDIR